MLDTREAYRVVVALSRVLSQLNSSDLRQALQQMNVSQLAKLKELTTLEVGLGAINLFINVHFITSVCICTTETFNRLTFLALSVSQLSLILCI